MTREVTGGAGRLAWKSERGAIEVTTPAPGVVVYRCTGHLDRPLVPAFIEPMIRAARARQHLDIFFDCGDVTGYDSEIRLRVTEAIDGVRQYTSAHGHVLVKSRLVGMGAWVMNMAIGKIDVHEDRSRFEQALVQVAASR